MADAIKPDDAQFAEAIVTRQLWDLPPLLAAPSVDEVVRSLECSINAARPRPALILRSLRKTLSLAAHDNDAIPRVAPLLHQLATDLPSDSKAGDVAAGLILLFAHGLGQAALMIAEGGRKAGLSLATKDKEPLEMTRSQKPLVVFLGFAGGTPTTLLQYSSRIYPDSEYDVMIVPASEIPEIYNASIDQVVASIDALRPSWSIHLFSKAGFLLCARLMERVCRPKTQGPDEDDARFLPPPKGVVWDSSPGSVTNYEEFIEGTWASAELIAKQAKFQFSTKARARLNAILRSDAYPCAVRDSYAPMHALVPFPVATEHLFLYSEKDPVCAPDEIRKYALESVALQRQVIVSGAHCDGLFWSGKLYLEAVRSLLCNVNPVAMGA